MHVRLEMAELKRIGSQQGLQGLSALASDAVKLSMRINRMTSGRRFAADCVELPRRYSRDSVSLPVAYYRNIARNYWLMYVPVGAIAERTPSERRSVHDLCHYCATLGREGVNWRHEVIANVPAFAPALSFAATKVAVQTCERNSLLGTTTLRPIVFDLSLTARRRHTLRLDMPFAPRGQQRRPIEQPRERNDG